MAGRRIQLGLRNFIVSHQWGDELSDFVRAATGDIDLPNARSWEQLEAYIKAKHPDATTNMLNSAKSIWHHYADSAERKRV
jgi:hypothetical protein